MKFATAIDKRKRREGLTWRILFCAAFFTLHSSLFISCSEEEDVEADEFSNWQQRNDAFWMTLEDSLKSGSEWKKIKHFTKEQTSEGAATDYIYVKVLESGEGSNVSPFYTDTVTTSYALRLIPTVSYPQGYLVQKTYYGNTFNWETTGTFKTPLNSSSLAVSGFITPLLHMHRGDRWRVYIPYVLAYNSQEQSSIPAYSILVYDLALIDFTHPKEQ